MSIVTEYYTAMGKKPVMSIIQQSSTGHATNIIAGLSVGMKSTVIPILTLAAGIMGSYHFAGLYGVAIAAAGMMATTAMQLAIDAFGPIADNAGGIAEMSQLPPEVRERTDNLDAVGNTTAATGKGFAIASAALTSLALFAAFVGIAGIDAIDIYKAPVLAGLFVGGMIPFVFSALCIQAVGKAAMEMVQEVRRQFREIPGIMEYKAKPEYDKCVAISTKASIKEMMLPGAIALITPVVVGFVFGPEVLGGLLAGVTVSGVLMGIFQSNAGGAWDNAKKSFEKGVLINGEMFYKKSEPHKASVTGDTVGDPFKDTSGPSMNILIKLMSIVSLVIAPYIALDIQATRKIQLENLNKIMGKSVVVADTSNLLKDAQGTETSTTAAGKVNAAGDYVYNTGALSVIDLPNDAKISLGATSDLNRLHEKIKANDAALLDKNNWFVLEDLYFESGSNKLKAGSENTLKSLYEMANAYNLNVKLGGYTDNTGDSSKNVALSQQRAETAKTALAKLGLAADRIEAEGYGPIHPICTTDNSAACLAQNRRIAVRITKK